MTVTDRDSIRGTDWDPLLKQEFVKPYWAELQACLEVERSRRSVYPPSDEVFTALHLTSYAKTKVVILGQDPYHGAGQAHGLAFSVPCGVRIPPTLANIHQELHDDLGVRKPAHGNLKRWACRGVLLLNTVLTVRADGPRSHERHGWETFTDEVIRAVDAKTNRVVFMLWGEDAKRKKNLIDTSRHEVSESSHPSPLSAWRSFFGSKPFSRANCALVTAGRDPVAWNLVGDCP